VVEAARVAAVKAGMVETVEGAVEVVEAAAEVVEERLEVAVAPVARVVEREAPPEAETTVEGRREEGAKVTVVA